MMIFVSDSECAITFVGGAFINLLGLFLEQHPVQLTVRAGGPEFYNQFDDGTDCGVGKVLVGRGRGRGHRHRRA